MVTKKSLIHLTLLTTILFVSFFISNTSAVEAPDIEYHLDHEWAKIWINQDGTLDLFYDIKIACDQGTIRYVKVGQPNSDFTIGEAWDENNNQLQTEDIISGNYYAVNVTLATPITNGESIRFNLTTNVGHMIWEDEDNPGNVGMQFIPVNWTVEVYRLNVSIVMPQGVTTNNVRNTPDWDNAYNDPAEDNRLMIFWTRSNLSPNESFECGVSFPKEYIQHYEKREKGLVLFLKSYGPIIAFFAFFFGIAGIVVYKGVKRGYATPSLRMETLGIKYGLTAVEASWLLDLPPTKIVTEILYSLLMKKAIWVTATKPSLELKVMEPFQDKAGTPETPLRYYEKSFLEAIKPDGTLSEEKLAKTIMFLRDNVEEKLRGYCRRDTIEYYRNIATKAWEQVEQAGTPELASKAYDENLLWLLLHDDFSTRTKDAFRERIFTPEAGWWWYWYGYTYYHPRPTYKPSPTTTTPSKPPTIPGAEFANNVVTSIEKTSNNIVANMEKFANSIIPRPPPSAQTSRAPVHHGSSCACACVSCACVCACVSCACACASGGVG